MECVVCEKKLTGRQTKYCSQSCSKLYYINKTSKVRYQLKRLKSQIQHGYDNVKVAEKKLRIAKRKVEILTVKREELKRFIHEVRDEKT